MGNLVWLLYIVITFYPYINYTYLLQAYSEEDSKLPAYIVSLVFSQLADGSFNHWILLECSNADASLTKFKIRTR